MATGNEEAVFSLILEDVVSDNAEKAASAVEELRSRMAAGESSVKDMNQSLRRLRGSTDEVKAAKEQLKAKINAEKDSISAGQLAMLKSTVTTKKLTDQTKLLNKQKTDAAARQKAMTGAVTAAGGPVATLKGKLDSLTEVLGNGSSAMSLATLGIAGMAAAAAALVVGVGSTLFELGKFIITGADVARTAGLVREAFGGSASNGIALGEQVDALSRKIPMGKDAIDALAGSLLKSGIEGQTFVDTLNAVGQASSALGEDAGAKIRELIERGKINKRFSVQGLGNGFDELQGTGITRDDVAGELAKSMGVSIGKARQALAEGRVKLSDGAKAMSDAINSKLGGINLKQMLSLPVMAKKFRETLTSLTKDINLEPILKGFKLLADLFDENTVTGLALKGIITDFGNAISVTFEKGAPILKKFFQGMTIAVLKAEITFFKLRNQMRDTFGNKDLLKDVDALGLALDAGAFAVNSVVTSMAALAVVLAPMIIAAYELSVAWKKVKEIFTGTDWKATGESLVDGLIDGITGGTLKSVQAVKDLATKVKDGFKKSMGIESPSKVFKGYGENTVDGFTDGTESKIPEAARSLDSLAKPPSGGASGSAKGGSVSVSMPITITVAGGQDAAKQLTDPAFLAQLTKALESVLISAGVPVS